MFFGAAKPAQATHFRYGTIAYTSNGSGLVNFRFIAAFRRSGYTGTAPDSRPKIGDIISENIGGTRFEFGDGSSTGTLRFVVRAFSASEDFIIGEALEPGSSTPVLTHTYTGAGPFNAGINSSARISNLGNRANGTYTLRTLVRPQSTNSSPLLNSVPTLVVPQRANATFSTPAADPNGDRLRYRLATSAEAGGGTDPPNLTINPTTGVLTWNNLGLSTTVFYTTQVIIEDLDSAGNVKSSVPLDLLLRIGSGSGLAPEIEVHANGQHNALTVGVGTPVVITVEGTDTDAGSQITLNSSGLPSNATVTPGLPITGPSGILSTIRFTPTTAQIGVIVITFSATDNTGLQTVSSLTITVVAGLSQLSINDVSVVEGNSGTVNATFTIRSTTASASPITVRAATANGTTNPATAGSDYVASSNQLVTIPAGATTATFTVLVNGDTAREADETFFVNLSSPSGAAITDAQGIGTIRNDDSTADLQITQTVNPVPVPINGSATITLTVRNNGPDPSNAVTIVNTLPAGIGAVTSNTAFTRNGQVLTFALGTLALGATRTITITMTVPGTAGSLTNTASVSGTGVIEVNTANNNSTGIAQVIAGPSDVTSALAITQGNLIRSGPYTPSLYRPGARFVQLVTIRNTSGSAITGPVSLVFNNLPAGVEVSNATGTTANSLPAGRPFLDFNVGSDNVLRAGETATVRVEFRLTARNRPSFSAQVLAGPGTR